jgi:hypothetical protein
LADYCVLLKAFDRQVLESSMFPVASEIFGKFVSSHYFAPLIDDLAKMGKVENFFGRDLLLISMKSEAPESENILGLVLTNLPFDLSQFSHFECKFAES